MNKKIKILFTTFFFIAFLFLLIGFAKADCDSGPTYTCPAGIPCPGGECQGGLVPCGRTCDDPCTKNCECAPCTLCHLFVLFKRIVDFLTINIVFPLAILMIVVGGVMFLTAGGDPGRIGNAKKILTATVIGLAIILAAWLIVDTVIMFLVPSSSPFQNWETIDCPVCGDGNCDSGETTTNCPADCGAPPSVCTPSSPLCNGVCPAGCTVAQDPDCGCLSGNSCCGIGCNNASDSECPATAECTEDECTEDVTCHCGSWSSFSGDDLIQKDANFKVVGSASISDTITSKNSYDFIFSFSSGHMADCEAYNNIKFQVWQSNNFVSSVNIGLSDINGVLAQAKVNINTNTWSTVNLGCGSTNTALWWRIDSGFDWSRISSITIFTRTTGPSVTETIWIDDMYFGLH